MSALALVPFAVGVLVRPRWTQIVAVGVVLAALYAVYFTLVASSVDAARLGVERLEAGVFHALVESIAMAGGAWITHGTQRRHTSRAV